jgi:hypothetical protein
VYESEGDECEHKECYVDGSGDVPLNAFPSLDEG